MSPLSPWILLLVCFAVLPASRSFLFGQNRASGVLDEATAKSVLRVKRGFWGAITGEDEEEEEASEARNRERTRESNERNREDKLNRECPNSCWNSWPSGWEGCSQVCGGGGVQWQGRSVRSDIGECQPWVAANGCPGSSRRSQACNRFCHNGGTPHANGCNCPAGWTDGCCGTRVTCPSPGQPANGAATPAGTGLIYGTVVSFSCNQGYNLVGDTSRTCTSSGSWTGSVPSCNIVSCGNPGTPANAKLEVTSGNNFFYDSSVRVTCNYGYRIIGDAVRRCDASGQWSGTAPSCEQIVCPVQPAPTNGQINYPSGRTLDKELTYTCNPGYYLQGGSTRKCQSNGQWTGQTPMCQQILCNNLAAPEHGQVVHSSSTDGKTPYGGTATFSCDSGYVLQGSAQLTCQGDSVTGNFSGRPPTCQPVNCGDPGTPENGVMTGSIFTLDNTVSFTCSPGHYLQGQASLKCLPTGQWSADRPLCNACGVNTYKTGTTNEKSCVACPEYSSTRGHTGASAVTQCLCDTGYKGPPGGPCTLILCPELPAPMDGLKGECGRKLNEKCLFECAPGHVVSSGDTVRTCTELEKWTGADVVCTACPENTYRFSESQCKVCPNNTHTNGTGHDLTGCVCDDGYEGPIAPGEPCTDINECDTNNGNCEQTCVNEEGRYTCECTNAGFVKDAEDLTKCVPKNNCPEMTQPANGGTICYSQRKTNTERCFVKCNNGFEHLQSPNAFEECGPSTGWKWSYEIKGVPLPDCIPAFFEGIQTEIEVFYFVEDCASITNKEKENIVQDFIQFLTEKGVCQSSDKSVCSIEDVEIDCGSTFRKKRDTNSQELMIIFKIKVPQQQLPTYEQCDKQCKDKTTAEIRKNIETQVQRVVQVYKEIESENVTLGGVPMVAMADVQVGEQEPSCDRGQEDRNGTCVPVSCGYPEPPDNGDIMPHGHLYGAFTEFTCSKDYILMGDNTTWCQADGTWMNFTTSCVYLGDIRYDCVYDNPCNPRRLPTQYYYRHLDDDKFIQCGPRDICYTVFCPKGLVWSKTALVCVWPWQQYYIDKYYIKY